MEIVVTGIAFRDPSMSTAPLPNCLSICTSADCMARRRSSVFIDKTFQEEVAERAGKSQEKNLPKIFAGGRPSPASASGRDSLSSYPVKHRKRPTTASNCRLLSWSIMDFADSLSASRSMRLLSPIRMLELEMPEQSSAEAGA